jgi:carboxymethylenebutenolidase
VSVTELDVRTDDGVMDVYLHAPPGVVPAPAVIFFADAGGVRAAMHEMAERLASAGYLVAVPNVLYRSGDFTPFDLATVFTDPGERARLTEVNSLADPASVMRDTGVLLDALAAQPGVWGDQVGCIGYCRGGLMTFTAAGAHPARVAAAAAFHAGNIATEDPGSPHLQAGNIRGALYFGVADNDPSCPPEAQARLAAALDEAKVDYELELYAGKGHGFAVPDNPTFDADAAERHWSKALDLFARTLPAP